MNPDCPASDACCGGNLRRLPGIVSGASRTAADLPVFLPELLQLRAKASRQEACRSASEGVSQTGESESQVRVVGTEMTSGFEYAGITVDSAFGSYACMRRTFAVGRGARTA